MSFKRLIMLAVLGATPLAAKITPKIAAEPEHRITVCMDRRPDVQIAYASLGASRLFAAVDVELEWHTLRTCPTTEDAIHIVFSDLTSPANRPGALAYAYPYQTGRVVIFYDRVEASTPRTGLSRLLAYVMAHEIAHVLQAVSRHSENGIMKSVWNGHDRAQIQLNTLEFSLEDIEFIHKGIKAREAKWATTLAASLR
jgi:hypothetical protein